MNSSSANASRFAEPNPALNFSTSPAAPTTVLKQLQPWFLSIVLHTLLLLALGLWVFDHLSGDAGHRIWATYPADDSAMADFTVASVSAYDPTVAASMTPAAVLEQPVAAPLDTPPDLSPLDALDMSNPPSASLASMELFTRSDVWGEEVRAGEAKKKLSNLTREASGADKLIAAAGIGEAGEVVTGVIRSELEQGNTLIVWLFDASASLTHKRSQMADHAESFYKSIEAFNTKRRDKAENENTLFSSVIAFGQNWREILRPTHVGARAISAMTKVPIDTSGDENVMSAVTQAVQLYREQRKRQERIMIVILTDESGDDTLRLEDTIEYCRSAGVAVHVIGPNAVMGCERGSQLCHIPSGGREYAFWLPVKKGPETSLPERFLVPYWHESSLPLWQQSGASVAANTPWYGGPYRERLHSGFGPFALTRLALQTGGSFTMLDEDATRSVDQWANRKDYLPDYASVNQYVRSLQDYPVRKFVVDAATLSYQQAELFVPPRMTFLGERSPVYPYPVLHPYVVPANFRTQLSRVLQIERTRMERASEVLQSLIVRLEDTAVPWQDETSPRWQASFALTKGRVYATQARYLEYLAATLNLKSSLSPETNEITLLPDAALRSSESRYLVDAAVHSLQKCIAEHPDTPWAYLAQWELDIPVGLRIQPAVIPRPPPPPPRPPGGPGYSTKSSSGSSFSFPRL
ncbi:vWA domain-containing protein [Novipirellula sp.]|uniref:vWA domain-containing protein n=1 Tax=Novipirellula sp. TaxID=2795430 RepID=UPI00356A9958